MALSPLAQNAISQAGQSAKYLVITLKPVLDELNTLYNSTGGLKTTIVQSDLDGVASYSGITKTQLDDGMFALTATLLNDITAAYSQLAQLAAHAGN